MVNFNGASAIRRAVNEYIIIAALLAVIITGKEWQGKKRTEEVD